MSWREQRNSWTILAVSSATAVLGYYSYYYQWQAKQKKKETPKLPRRLPTSREDAKCLQPLTLPCGLTLKNRIVRAAAFGGSDIDSLLQTHVEVAEGGVAMTTVAYASVSQDGMTFANQILLAQQNFLPDLQKLADAVHAKGSMLSLQLAHAGSFATASVTGTQTIAPSGIFNIAGFDFARAMTRDDMDRVAADFLRAACMAQEAGCDAVELHCGHGYLLSQFLCPATNTRTDEFGGASIENRLRFPLRVLREIRKTVTIAVLVKMNLSDGFDGLSIDDAKAAAVAFGKAGADALVLSGGFTSRNGFYMLRGTVPYWSMARALGATKGLALLLLGRWLVPRIDFEECFFLQQARHVLGVLQDNNNNLRHVPVCLIGGVVSLSGIEGVLEEGFHLVQMARALIQNPRMVRDIEESLPLLSSSSSTIKTSNQTKATTSAAVNDVRSKCTHCNECVVSTIDPTRVMHCPIKETQPQDDNKLDW
ncbi:NADPH dehydrogenase [Seminavis robusta]|uniref:NADPH dehydrogenase n=1 Tax=Seminavis robusta TaxID=568900 RepID=A0A9N8HIA6_9STRA|nr:NADPH dehydrogenase [Seminavis robusta]|eukprot:Sro612_g175420.1 NADPH dehydrogenase (480) ;mRNA; r:11054-12493